MSEKNMKNIPKRRFPEFVNDGEWEEKKLGDIATIKTGSKNTQDRVKDGKYPFFVRSNTIERIDSYSFEGEAILTAGDGVGVGKVFHYLNEKFDYHQRVYNIHDFKNNILGKYLYFYFVDRFYTRVMKFNAKNSVDSVRMDAIANMPIPLPSLQEQQKIADCLSSVDGLISAQSQKVELLKEHKKGLMQQLFPSEGESVPKLRFPEFINDGEWEEKKLGDLCDYWNGGSHENSLSEYGQYYLISLNSLDIEGNLKTDMKRIDYLDNSLQKDDLVMVLSDVAHGNFLGLTAIIPSDNFVLNQRMAGLRKKKKEKIVIEFLRLSINYNQKYFKQHGQGSSQLNLSKSSVTDFPVLTPTTENEQQKIADCLSLIDEQISQETGKLQTLKEHKKALMQQLFPKSI